MVFNFLSDVIGIEFLIGNCTINYLMVKENHLAHGTKFCKYFYFPDNFFTKKYVILDKFALDKNGRTCYYFKADFITRIMPKSETYYYVQNK